MDDSNGSGKISIEKTVPSQVTAPTEIPSPIVLLGTESVMYPYGLDITVRAKNTANSEHSAFIEASCYNRSVMINEMTVDATFHASETREFKILLDKDCVGGTYNVTVVGSSDDMRHGINVV